MFTFLAISAVLVLVFYIYFVKSPPHLRGIPRVSPWYPVLGNAGLLLGKPGEDVFESLNAQFARHDRLFQLWLGPKLTIGVSHPDLVRKVLTSATCLDKPFFYRFSRMDQALWAAKKELWQSQRKALNTTFSQKILNNFIPIFEQFSMAMLDQLNDRKSTTVNLLHFSTVCTLKMICGTTMGIKAANDAENENFTGWMDRISEIISNRFFAFHMYTEAAYRLTPSYRREMKYRRKCYDYTLKILEEKKRKLTERSEYKNELSKLFIEQLLDTSLVKRSFSDPEIIQNVYNMIAAGSETTARAIADACLFLAMFPNIQDKVYAEILQFCPAPSVPITPEMISSLCYVELFLKECLRHCPVAPAIARETSEPFELDGTHFPSGTVFILNFYELHRRRDVWGPDCELFDPERFSHEASEGRHPFAYLPFSGGPRNCIGSRYAMISLKVMIVHILRSFRLTTDLHFEDLRYRFGVMLTLSPEHLIRIEKREKH